MEFSHEIARISTRMCVCACVHRSFECLASSDACSAVVVQNMQFSADITNNACLIVSAVDVKLRSKEQIYYMRCSWRRRRRRDRMGCVGGEVQRILCCRWERSACFSSSLLPAVAAAVVVDGFCVHSIKRIYAWSQTLIGRTICKSSNVRIVAVCHHIRTGILTSQLWDTVCAWICCTRTHTRLMRKTFKRNTVECSAEFQLCEPKKTTTKNHITTISTRCKKWPQN